MGRGRQKAKQAKIARDLKYYSPPTDLSALERELGGKHREEETRSKWDEDEDLYEDKWASQFDDEDDELDDDTSR